VRQLQEGVGGDIQGADPRTIGSNVRHGRSGLNRDLKGFAPHDALMRRFHWGVHRSALLEFAVWARVYGDGDAGTCTQPAPIITCAPALSGRQSAT